MRLAIFDIDGTLTQTLGVDDTCFVKAFAEEFNLMDVESDWSDYRDRTDLGIASEILRNFYKREPTQEEIERHKRRFLILLRLAHENNPSQFREITGASRMLTNLKHEKNWATALATGGWIESAKLKLQAAGLDVRGIPLASADNGLSREQIMKTAIARAILQYDQDEFEKVVLMGDSDCDVDTALKLGIGFIGIGSGKAAKELRRAGATDIVGDFGNLDAFFDVLCNATVPGAFTMKRTFD